MKIPLLSLVSRSTWLAGLAAIVCLWPAQGTLAAVDAQPLILKPLAAGDGLPQGAVLATLQDSQGFVWLGTEDGLVRYDGHELVRYAHSQSAVGSLPANFIYQVIEDAHHDLWIAMKDTGIARWNRASDTFTTFRHDAANPNSLASDAVRTLTLDATGQLWIGTSDAGIDVLDPVSGQLRHLRHADADPQSLIDDRIFTLTRDRAGSIWVGTQQGLDRWQQQSRGFAHYGRSDAALNGRQISRVLEDHAGTFWIATYDAGLVHMDSAGHLMQAFRHDGHSPNSLSSDDVRALLEDQGGHLWVGTTEGLDLLAPSAGTFTHYAHEKANPESLSDSFVMSLYQDPAGLVWIGTKAGGVSRWNPRSWELGGLRPDWLTDKLVTAFADTPDNKVWVATLGGGLFRFDPDTGTATELEAVSGGRAVLADKRVMSLHADRSGALWIGTMTHGVARLMPDGRLQTIPVKAGDPHSLSDGGIMVLSEANDGRVFIGTHDGGLNVLDQSSGTIRQLPFGAGAGAVSSASVTAIAEDAQGNLWIGTDGGGLDLARADGTVVQVYRNDPNDTSSLPANTVYALAIDAQQRVWVATDSGLASVVGTPSSPGALHFKMASQDPGLSSEAIWGVLSDADGYLWLSSSDGLMRFDPRSGRVKHYHRENGLQGEDFDFGAYYRLRDGRLCFGGPGGLNVFDPRTLSKDPPSPKLALTQLQVLGVPVRTATPYWLLQQIPLDYRASIISLDFAALDFTSPKLNRLSYRMSGLTDQWIELGPLHRITLTNLDSGDHVLEVRAANADGLWGAPLRLKIHKTPAPWRSPLAYALYGLIVLAVVLYRMHRQRQKFREIAAARDRLESEVALRTRELTESNRQLAEAARAKSDFLDRMSHELRTPMNGVVGMTELLARTPMSSMQQRLTGTIRSSAEVLLRIVNDLLDLSKIQLGKVKPESLPFELVPLLEDSASLFMGAAEAKGVELTVVPPSGMPLMLLGDALRLRQILMNLIGNAIKFTAHGEVRIEADILAVQESRATLRIGVHDTGIGMDAATISRIFDPFTQADESTTRRFGGSGLGLAICRELATLLGGTIDVESQPGVGSSFSLSLTLPTAAASPAAPALSTTSVCVLTRRKSLAEGLSRHLAALGVGNAAGAMPSGAELDRSAVIILDAGSQPEFLEVYRQRHSASRPRLIVIASSAERAVSGVEGLIPAACILSKPVQRQALYEALATATNQLTSSSSTPRTPSLPEEAIGCHVLLVEDEAVNAAVAQGYLAALKCSCVWVDNGAEAAARSASEHFDAILMDLSMPDMDGFVTTELIRKREGSDATGLRTPIIALTAHEADGYIDACLAAGMNDLLTKPYTLQACATMLRRWVAARPGQAAGSALEDPLTRIDSSAVAALLHLQSGAADQLYAELIDLFATSSRSSMLQLQEAMTAADGERIGAVCHKLKSSAANVGAMVFSNHLKQLGESARAGESERMQQLYHAIQTAYPGLMDALRRVTLKEVA